MDPIFLLSVILNVVLGFAFFFRSAINDVVRDWWKERRQKRKEEQSRLYELNQHLTTYPVQHLCLTLQIMLIKEAQTTTEVQMVQESVESGEASLKQVLDFITANEVRFSDDIRAGLKELREASDIGDVMLQGQYKHIPETNHRVTAVCDRLRRMVEEELKRF